jgi:hypothetical protein
MTLKFLALQGAPYIYDISTIRVNKQPAAMAVTDSTQTKTGLKSLQIFTNQNSNISLMKLIFYVGEVYNV